MKTNNLVAGLDIGSRSIELVFLEGGRMADWAKLPTTFDPLAQCRRLLQSVNGVPHRGHRLRPQTPEGQIPGPAGHHYHRDSGLRPGARDLCPQARTVLDIGGQDTKAIALTPDGRVAKFDMNDRCAAGTGKFLEFMATALQVDLEAFGAFALQADKRIQINSMCTVFAESEATSLMARGETAANIAMGLHLAIVQRTAAMLRRVGLTPPLAFAGGVAHNPCVLKLLEETLQVPILVPEQPDLVGALGAALYGSKR